MAGASPGSTSTSLRARTDASEWPSPYRPAAVYIPSEHAESWTPERYRVAVACLRTAENGRGEIAMTGSVTSWDSVAEAADTLRAVAAAQPCAPGCLGNHVVAVADPATGVHTRAFPSPPTRSLADEFLSAGYRVNGIRRKSRFTGATFDAEQAAAVRRRPAVQHTEKEKITVTDQPEPTDDDARRIIAAEQAAGTLLARLGLSRRAALAHREVADALARGASPEEIDAAEALAKALTDAAIAPVDATG